MARMARTRLANRIAPRSVQRVSYMKHDLVKERKTKPLYGHGGYTCLCICENYKISVPDFDHQSTEKVRYKFYS